MRHARFVRWTLAGREQGIAMMTALAVMFIAIGVLFLMTFAIGSRTDQASQNRQGIEGSQWLKIAADDVATQLQEHKIGATYASPATVTGSEFGGAVSGASYTLWSVPQQTLGNATWTAVGDEHAFKVTTATGQTGYYEIESPLPGTNAPAWSVAFETAGNGYNSQVGTVTAVLKGWMAGSTRASIAQVVFRQGTLARYSVLSDDPVTITGTGVNVTGSVHSNNSLDAANGVVIGTGVNTSQATEISATFGTIKGTCSASGCYANTKQAVDIGDAELSFSEVARQSGGSCASGQPACMVKMSSNWAPSGMVPVWQASLSGSCVDLTERAWPARTDIGQSIPEIDDTVGIDSLNNPASVSQYCPPPGGGAILLQGDVVIRGELASNAPSLDILAQRKPLNGSGNPNVVVNGKSEPVVAPASIWVLNNSNGATIGTASATNPLGLVAEGGVYIPSDYLAAGRVDNTLHMANTAVVAEQGEFALGPGILNIESDTGSNSDAAAQGAGQSNEANGNGLDPCAAEGFSSLYHQASTFTFIGSIVSHRSPNFRYGADTTSCYVGYNTRAVSYPTNMDLTWNPPAFFPTDEPWHVDEWHESN